MTSITDFPYRVADFERAPWLPVVELEKTCDRLARWVALDVAADSVSAQTRRDAQAVRLMRDEDMRIVIAYGAAYRDWKASVAA